MIARTKRVALAIGGVFILGCVVAIGSVGAPKAKVAPVEEPMLEIRIEDTRTTHPELHPSEDHQPPRPVVKGKEQ